MITNSINYYSQCISIIYDLTIYGDKLYLFIAILLFEHYNVLLQDTIVYTSFKITSNFTSSINDLQHCLLSVQDWMFRNLIQTKQNSCLLATSVNNLDSRLVSNYIKEV